nr:MAG TPA: hypothetical protein [Caudoviricetes sp.]
MGTKIKTKIVKIRIAVTIAVLLLPKQNSKLHLFRNPQ